MRERNIKIIQGARVLQIPVSTAYRWMRPKKKAKDTIGNGRSSPEGTPWKNLLKKEQDNLLKSWIKEVKVNHIYWGRRRVCAYIKRNENVRPLGRKRISRLMKELGLQGKSIRGRKPMRRHLKKARASAPRKHWEIDMTSFQLTSLITLYLVVVIDIFTRKIVGWHLSKRCRTREWKKALDMAVEREFSEGVRGKELVLRADNGCQPTSSEFIRHLNLLDIQGEWTGYNCPEENAFAERVIRTIKEEAIWPYEYDIEDEAQEGIAKGILDYNQDYPHSSLKDMSPDEFERAFVEGRVHFTDEGQLKILQKVA